MIEITHTQFQKARSILKGKALVTPLVDFNIPNQKNPIYLKAECLQPGGSFKIRGATYCISRLGNQYKEVVAYSTGNHAQGVAIAAKQMGLKATIVMSPGTLESKIEATCRFGAEVIMVPAEKRKEYAEELALSKGAYLIPPYDHPDVITGQGTIGLEILDEIPNPAAVFVPIGGGGLIAGIATAIKQQNPKVKIIGVEPELENDAWRSFTKGERVTMGAPSNTIADAVRIPSLGDLTFPLIKAYVDDIITVSEKEIIDATLMIPDATRLIAEPSGALSVAGVLKYPHAFPSNKAIICVVSGGNSTLRYICEMQSASCNNKPHF